MKDKIHFVLVLILVFGVFIAISRIPSGGYLPMSSLKPTVVIEEDLPAELVFGDKNIMRIVHEIENLKPGQTMRLYVGSGGGDMGCLFELVNALKMTKGNVDMYASGVAASAAACILPFAHNVVAGPYTLIIIHEAYRGPEDAKIRDAQDPAQQFANRFMRTVWEKILTPEQMAYVEAGHDLFLDGPTEAAIINQHLEK